MSRRRRTRLHVFVCWLWAQRAPKVTISGAVKTFSSTPRQSRRYQITDRRRGFLLFTLTHTHWRFVKAQRRSLRRPRYVCVYYFYEIDWVSALSLRRGPELYAHTSIASHRRRGEQPNLPRAAGRNRICIRALRKTSSGRCCCGHSHFSSSPRGDLEAPLRRSQARQPTSVIVCFASSILAQTLYPFLIFSY